MGSKPISRREWLRRGFLFGTVGTILATLGGIILDVWLAAGRFSSAHWTQLALIDSLPHQATVPFPEKRVAILRRGSRLAALSLECTHLGCLVNTMGDGFFCPCHGSEFGPMGEVYTGPASKPLQWHAVLVRHGRVWIHTGKKKQEAEWVFLGQERSGTA